MIYEFTNVQLTKMLQNLLPILDKAALFAEVKKFEADILLNARLAPDQFNFIRQIQIVCDTAKLGASRLTGKEAPTQADTEKTLPELKTRIESVITYLQKFTAADYSETSVRQVTQPRWEGQFLTGNEYALHHVVPNFYFHMSTAYSILRHNGVEIGKKDYLGKMPFKK
ncbi:MAG: DUF1993 domain-containing protein [Pseudobdellovibrio sp.]